MTVTILMTLAFSGANLCTMFIVQSLISSVFVKGFPFFGQPVCHHVTGYDHKPQSLI